MAPNAVLAPIAPRTPIAPGASNAPAVAVLAATTGAHVAPRVPASPDAPLASDASETTLADAHDMLMLGQYDEAAKVYAALTADPRQATAASIGLARCWIQTGRYDDAITALHDARAPDNADWHAALAAVLTRTGRYEDVLRHAESAVRLDPGHTDARLVLGRTLELLGRRDEAIATYRWFDRQIAGRPELPRDAVWITNTAVGFLRYSVLTRTNVTRRVKHVLEEMLQVAYERLDRSWWPARIAAADLLRERFNNDEHDGSVSDYKAALRINGNLPEAHVGLGEVALDAWDFDEVERRAALALGINPNFSPAIRLLAKNLLIQRRYDDVVTMCARALSINPNDLAAMGLSAGASACRYDDEATRRMAARASTINPRSAVFYRTLGDALGGIRQYEAAEQAYRRAIEYDPTDANARTELGMLYMQWGVEAKARDALQAAWALDEYNARTHFTLELLESLDAFSKHETEHFVIKYDKHRDRGLGPYVAEYLEQIYDDVTGDYATTLADKTIIELFPTHRAFGVRITGKPWIHTVGACTGRVIALASPREAPDLMGPYNFARVLLHEFTHTVTLAATDNRIPHWFTEGLAVYQEDTPRSFGWWRLLAEAARRDELFTLTSIDWGFMRPQRPTDREMAYAQSEWMCQYIVQRFGYDVINTMLHAFHERRTQAQAFTDVLGIDVDAFDKDFHTWARSELRRIGFDLTPPEDVAALRELAQAEPDNAAVHGRFARAEFDQGHAERALASARRALALDERNRHALDVLLRVLAGQAAHAASRRAQAALDDEAWPIAKRLAQIDPDAWIAHRQMGEIALRRHQLDDAVEAFQRLQRLCPLDPASWRGLAGVYLQRGDDDLALPQLLELARTEEHDADVPASIARIYTRQRRLRDAEYWYRQALYVNPFATNLHEALADVSMQLGDTAAALREYTMLTELMPDHAPYFASAAAAAHKIGDAATAATMARKAVALDPASPARALVPQP